MIEAWLGEAPFRAGRRRDVRALCDHPRGHPVDVLARLNERGIERLDADRDRGGEGIMRAAEATSSLPAALACPTPA